MEITAEEKNILEQVYGISAFTTGYGLHQIEEVRELTAAESRFFERKSFISPQFYVQTLYKVRGELSPVKFNLTVKTLVAEDENFRANFCGVGTRTVKVIFKERDILPEIVYRVLKADAEDLDEILVRIMEADRRLNFDVREGSLIRFSAFRTGEDEAAILVTMLQVISERFNSESFFSAVFGKGAYEKLEPRAELKLPQVESRVEEYWTEILRNLPAPPKIPYAKKFSGRYCEEIYRVKIPADISSDLRGKAQSNRVMLMSILQTAWGFVLQATNKTADVAFCQLTSGSRSAQGLSLNLIPVRMKTAKTSTLESIVTQQFKQLVVSQPYGFFDWSELEVLTTRRGNLFDHFLSFVDFSAEDKIYSQVVATATGEIVERNSWDAQGMKLGIYFQYAKTDLSISFRYDKNQFAPNAGKYLANLYNLILRQMLVYWHSPLSEFLANIEKVTAEMVSTAAGTSAEDERRNIIDFIHKNKILQSDSTGAVNVLAEKSKLLTCFEGDRLFGDILEKNLVFVVEGKLSRSLDKGDGWFNALDIIKAGGWINENVFLEKRRTTISAEVLTERAVLLIIPLSSFESATLQSPALYKSFLRQISAQMEKYQLLWLQS